MDRDQLDARHVKVLRKHLPGLRDNYAVQLPAYLDDMAAVAEEHAGSRDGEHRGLLVPPVLVSDRIPASPAAQAAKAAPARRTAARRSAK